MASWGVSSTSKDDGCFANYSRTTLAGRDRLVKIDCVELEAELLGGCQPFAQPVEAAFDHLAVAVVAE
jgi:hypothetical protein